jgi:hypothetical protein
MKKGGGFLLASSLLHSPCFLLPPERVKLHLCAYTQRGKVSP